MTDFDLDAAQRLYDIVETPTDEYEWAQDIIAMFPHALEEIRRLHRRVADVQASIA